MKQVKYSTCITAIGNKEQVMLIQYTEISEMIVFNENIILYPPPKKELQSSIAYMYMYIVNSYKLDFVAWKYI